MWSPKYKTIAEVLFTDRQGARRFADLEQLILFLISELEISGATARQLASELNSETGSSDYFWSSEETLTEFLETRVAELHENARRNAIEELQTLRATVQERIAAHRLQTELVARTAATMAAEWDALSTSISATLDVLMEGPRT